MKQDIEIEKIRLVNVTVALSLLFVFWNVYVGYIPYPFQIGFFLLSMLISGIPHGALDHIVQQENERRANRLFNNTTFTRRYLAPIAIYALAWYLAPQLSFIIFILMSCWHFGETDIINIKSLPILTVTLRFTYGVCIIAWILITHHAQATEILVRIIPANSTTFHLWLNSVKVIPFYYILSFLIMALVVSLMNTHFNRLRSIQVCQLLIIIISTRWLPLLPAFAVYFAGWHSVITLFNIKAFISGANTNKRPEKNLWVKALPFSLLAITGLIITAVLLNYFALLFNPLPLVFVFLSVITLPHMQVMHKLNNKLIS